MVVGRERRRTLHRWQEEFDGGERGRWTKRVIQNVEAWTERRHGDKLFRHPVFDGPREFWSISFADKEEAGGGLRLL